MTTDQHTAPGPAFADPTAARHGIEVARTAQAAVAPSELAQAFGYADDRSQRLDDALSVFEDAITRLGLKLEPILHDGQPGQPPKTVGEVDPSPAGEDRRSQVTRRVHGLAVRYDRAADYVQDQTRRIHGILEALEV